MTKTNKNPLKDQRPWDELQSEKRAFIKRKQDEEEAKKSLREFDPYNGRWDTDDDSPKSL